MRSIAPKELKAAFEDAGFKVIAQDEFNWAMASGEEDEPFILPKKGRRVCIEIMQAAIHRATSTDLHNCVLRKVQEVSAMEEAKR